MRKKREKGLTGMAADLNNLMVRQRAVCPAMSVDAFWGYFVQDTKQRGQTVFMRTASENGLTAFVLRRKVFCLFRC